MEESGVCLIKPVIIGGPGNLVCWTAMIAGQPVKALVDSGSSASFLLFELLKNCQES